MPSDESRSLAAARRGIVIAPAGCGKTYLLAEAVACSSGRQLVLTHTHSGVRAMRKHLAIQGVPSAKYRIITIDGFALRYATAFPTLSGWTAPIPTGEDWHLLREATNALLQKTAIRRVLSASYSGVLVDEYQDCSTAQHRLIIALAEVLPVRVAGDPLQAIFSILAPQEYCRWQDVTTEFPIVAELNTPHRWKDKNESLGTWLSEVRRLLIVGEAIDLSNAPVIWKQSSNKRDQMRLSACYGVKSGKGHSMVALRKWRPECHHLARNLKGRFRAMETVECEDLLAWSQKLETATGVERVNCLLGFAELCIACLPAAVKQFGLRLGAGKPPKPQRDDYKKVLTAFEKVRDKCDWQSILEAMTAISELDHQLVIARHELWNEMQRTLREHQVNPSSSLRQTAWNLRNRLRHMGANTDKASLATPLLVKGLEYDHAVILDADDHDEAESLYVAMTRGSRSLTIVSDQPVLIRPRPRYLRHDETSAS